MRTWEDTYNLLVEYYNEFGTSNVKTKEVYHNVKLGSWVSVQRKNYKNGKLSDKQISLLNDIGFAFDMYDNSWDIYYNLAKDYYSTFGDLNIPKRYIISFNGKTYGLGRWIEQQRIAYSSKYEYRSISLQHIELLNNIGMVWNTNGTYTNQISFNECAIMFYISKLFPNTMKYRKNNVEIDIYIPELNLGIEYDGCAWHNNKKDMKKNMYCKNNNINLIRIRENGCENLNDNLSTNIYINPNDLLELENVIRSITNNLVDVDITRDMKDIYSSYDNIVKQSWKDKYNLCVSFVNEFGNFNMPATYITPSGVKLGSWLNEQRKAYKKGKLSQDKIDLLDKLGMVWAIYKVA